MTTSNLMLVGTRSGGAQGCGDAGSGVSGPPLPLPGSGGQGRWPGLPGLVRRTTSP